CDAPLPDRHARPAHRPARRRRGRGVPRRCRHRRRARGGARRDRGLRDPARRARAHRPPHPARHPRPAPPPARERRPSRPPPGPLTEHGTPAQYRRLRGIVEPAAARLSARAVYVAGNHDDRAALREHLLGEPPSPEPLDHTVRVGDVRIAVLDSTVPGHGHGQLTPEQLDRLRGELAEPAPAGTVLALHHPPLPSAAPLAASIPLLRRDELGAAIAGTDVRLVLAGHTHVTSSGTLAGVPVWTGG